MERMCVQNNSAYKYPCPSFKAMKASQFKGLDYTCMRKFKAPIEKFNRMNDFENWARKEFNKLTKSKLTGRTKDVTAKRKEGFAQWIEFLKDNIMIMPAASLLMLSAVLKGLKPDNEDLVPELNDDVFEKTLQDADSIVEKNKDTQFDLNKIYVNKLRESYGEKPEGWIVIPQTNPTDKDFEKNARKLAILSPRTWCTKDAMARDYVETSDMHIYYENGKPKLGIRLEEGVVQDISGVKNNSKIPYDFLDLAKNYVKENNFNLSAEVKWSIEDAENFCNTRDKIHSEIGDAIVNNDAFKILDYLGFEPIRKEDGTLSIERYHELQKGRSFAEFGIDEAKLFEQISEIRGDASFQGSDLTTLMNLKKIGGFATFSESNIIDTGELETIGKDAYFSFSVVKKLPKLKTINGAASISDSNLTQKDFKNIQCEKVC